MSDTMSDATQSTGPIYTDKPMYARRDRQRKSNQASRASVTKLILAYAAIVLAAYHAYSIHSSCGSGWVSSLLKSIGIQVLAFFLLVAVLAPLFSYNKDGSIRAITKLEKVMGSEVGVIVHLILSFLLARWWLICREGM